MENKSTAAKSLKQPLKRASDEKSSHTWYKVERAILQSSSPVRPFNRLRLNRTYMFVRLSINFRRYGTTYIMQDIKLLVSLVISDYLVEAKVQIIVQSAVNCKHTTVYRRYASISWRTNWTRLSVAELIHWSRTFDDIWRVTWSIGTNGRSPSTSSLLAFWTRNLYALYHGRKTSLTCTNIRIRSGDWREMKKFEGLIANINLRD